VIEHLCEGRQATDEDGPIASHEFNGGVDQKLPDCLAGPSRPSARRVDALGHGQPRLDCGGRTCMRAMVPADLDDISEADTLQRKMIGSPRQ